VKPVCCVDVVSTGFFKVEGSPRAVEAITLLQRESVNSSSLDVMVDCGLLQADEDEFFATVYRLKLDACAWASSRRAVEPRSVLRVPCLQLTNGPAGLSKLDLVLHLCGDGWSICDGPLEAHTPAANLEFVREAGVGKLSYLHALCTAEQIFERGAPCIHHGYPDGYYKCLHSSVSLAAMHDRADLAALKHADFLAIMQSGNALTMALTMM
jgi:hypothetical protein